MGNNFLTYVIQNEKDEIYIGSTGDFEKRLARHNGELKTKSTSFTHKRQRGLWRLIYSEEYGTRKEALQREKQLKSYQGRKFIRRLLIDNSGA